jgi:hypothetical protein
MPQNVAACGGSTFRGVLKPALSEAAPAKPAPPVENNLGGVAQRAEQSLVRREVVGSNPAVPASCLSW